MQELFIILLIEKIDTVLSHELCLIQSKFELLAAFFIAVCHGRCLYNSCGDRKYGFVLLRNDKLINLSTDLTPELCGIIHGPALQIYDHKLTCHQMIHSLAIVQALRHAIGYMS